MAKKESIRIPSPEQKVKKKFEEAHLAISLEEPNLLNMSHIALKDIRATGDHSVHEKDVGDNHEDCHEDGHHEIAGNTGVMSHIELLNRNSILDVSIPN